MGHVTVIAESDTELDQAIAVTRVHCKVVPKKSERVRE
jgi:hypothetical protein